MAHFYMPVRVFDEENAVSNHQDLFAKTGKKALIVSGRHSAKKNGAYQDIAEALEAGGVEHVLFDEIEENPSVQTIMRARDFGLAEGVDFVIGVGGGSPQDASKAIALMISNSDKDASFLFDTAPGAAHLPVILVPTTCGTGSEVTAISVLTVPELKTKKAIPHRIFGEYALIDGKYLQAAGRNVLHNTAFDALAHLYESYINSTATDYSKMAVDAGLKVWARSQDVFRGRRDPEPEDYTNMMRASMLGGLSIAHTGTVLPHGLSYPVTYNLHVPHGKAVTYFMEGYLAKASEADRKYVLETSGFTSPGDFREVFETACGRIEAPENELREILNGAVEEMAANPAKCALAPFEVDREVLREIAFYALDHT